MKMIDIFKKLIETFMWLVAAAIPIAAFIGMAKLIAYLILGE